MILLWCSGSAGVAAVPNPLGGDAAWMPAIATRSAPTWAKHSDRPLPQLRSPVA